MQTIGRLADDALQPAGSLLSLALELAPIRVNLIASGFVDTPLSAAILGDELGARRERLRATLPIRRVVRPEDVAALAVDTRERDGYGCPSYSDANR